MKKKKLAWLVVNHFVHAEKFETFYSMLIRTGLELGINIKVKTNVDLLVELEGPLPPGPRPDFVLFWDKDLNLCRHLERQGLRVFNSSHAIEVCDSKNLTALELAGHGIPQPRTILAPKTFRPDQYPSLEFLPEVGRRLGFPLVVKESFGSFGFQVHLAENAKRLEEIVREIGTRPMQFQEFVRSEWNGQPADVRLHVVGGKVVASVLRTAKEGDFRANVTNGGKMIPWKATPEQKKLAVRVCKILRTDFAGVDLLFGPDGPVLCEVNTNAHFKNLYDATGIDVGRFIMSHLLKKCGLTN